MFEFLSQIWGNYQNNLLFKTILKLRSKNSIAVADNGSIVKLVRISRRDPSFKNRLVSILSLDSYNRALILNSLIENMWRNNAPKDLIAAISRLKNEEVAKKVLYLIGG